MLPVWYLTTSWNGKQWNFAMNAQTGKFTGDLPVDYAKLGIVSGIGAVFGAVLFYLIMKSIPAAVIAALIVGLICFFVGKGSMRPVHAASEARDYMENQVRLVHSNERFVRTERQKKQQPQTNNDPK